MNNCIFCRIINKEIPASIIYEDKESFAFLDVHPRSPGHTMVLPKVHFENIIDLPLEKIESVFKTVKNITILLKEKIKPDGFTIGINHGKVSGQAIDHLHIHIIPRWLDDAGKSIHDVVNNPPKEDIEKIKEKILGS